MNLARSPMRSFGSLAREVRRRPRPRSRDDGAYLHSSALNAARLQEAIADAVAGRNMIPFTVEALRRDLGLNQSDR